MAALGPLNPQWVRDIITDRHRKGVAPFQKQWGAMMHSIDLRKTREW